MHNIFDMDCLREDATTRKLKVSTTMSKELKSALVRSKSTPGSLHAYLDEDDMEPTTTRVDVHRLLLTRVREEEIVLGTSKKI